MNTRLQVEHPVTGRITGVDLVEQQLAIAAGAPWPVPQEGLVRAGHAIEVRIYAEDPSAGFTPTTGPVLRLVPPAGARFDAGVLEGERVPAAFDPRIAKPIVPGADRAAALAATHSAPARQIGRASGRESAGQYG